MHCTIYFFPKAATILSLGLLLLFLPAAAQDKPEEVIKVNTDLIQTNVTVVDKDGRPVEGLKPDQFVLKIDGKPTKIEFFDQIFSQTTTGNFAEKRENSATSEEVKPATRKVSLRQRRVVFFLDDFHMSLDSIGRTRSTILHFIDYDMMPLDQVLIVTSSGNLGSLQMFTDNKALLRVAVSKLRTYPSAVADTEVPPMPEYVGVRIINGDLQVADYYVEEVLKGFNAKGRTPLSRPQRSIWSKTGRPG
jgi:VWFA-related protein